MGNRVKPGDDNTLASSWRRCLRIALTSPVTEESAKETVKTIAQGRPGFSGEPVVTTLVCFLFHTRGCGCGGHPAFPAPSVFRGAKRHAQLGRKTCRGNADAHPAVITAGGVGQRVAAQGYGP
jgi:hypothetical protein